MDEKGIGGRPKMMKILIQELEEAGIIDKNYINWSQTQQAKGTTQFNKYSRFRQPAGKSRVQR